MNDNIQILIFDRQDCKEALEDNKSDKYKLLFSMIYNIPYKFRKSILNHNNHNIIVRNDCKGKSYYNFIQSSNDNKNNAYFISTSTLCKKENILVNKIIKSQLDIKNDNYTLYQYAFSGNLHNNKKRKKLTPKLHKPEVVKLNKKSTSHKKSGYNKYYIIAIIIIIAIIVSAYLYYNNKQYFTI